MLAQMIQRFKTIWHGQGLVQLARLHDQGVADPVINYMQQTYLEAVRREQNLADWNTREMWGDHFGKPQERKETSGGEAASVKIRRLPRRMKMMSVKQISALVLSCALIVATSGCDNQEVQATAPPAIQPVQLTAEQLQQLVAPIALYPDELVAQILAASTYPTEIVEAERWLQQNSSLKGTQLASEVDKQSWDPSVKALTIFPSVLANMDKNLSWTSALGDAYFNNQQDVLNAVQVMRERAQAAGTLKTTPQQNVTTQRQTIIIEPANPQVVYVPQYDPWIVYGAPLAVYPGYIPGPWVAAPIVSFGVGFPIGWGFGWGWGWPAWGCDWGGGFVVFNHMRFISRSHTFFHHGHGFSRVATFPRQSSTIEPIVASLRRTWSGAATPAHSADSTTAAWQTSTPSAASPASAEVCTAILGAGSEAAMWWVWRRRRPQVIGKLSRRPE